VKLFSILALRIALIKNCVALFYEFTKLREETRSEEQIWQRTRGQSLFDTRVVYGYQQSDDDSSSCKM